MTAKVISLPSQPTAQPAQPLALIKLPEVLRRTALGKTTIYTLIKSGEFPAQISLFGGKSVAFIESEVNQWISDRISAARGVAA
jgi:prophage regulatory protein